jgi:hypothetical protein
VATLGDGMEQRVAALFAERRASLAVALDGVANELLWALSRRVQDRLLAAMRRHGLCVAGELRAGDPGLALKAQQVVLDLAGAQRHRRVAHDHADDEPDQVDLHRPGRGTESARADLVALRQLPLSRPLRVDEGCGMTVPSTAPAPAHRIDVPALERHIECREDETVFAAARRAGVRIVGACGGRGSCGSCIVRVVEGRVHREGEGSHKPSGCGPAACSRART